MIKKANRVVGFMDIGTNSMRLLVVRVDANGSYAVLSRQKESIRLGEGEFSDRVIQPEAMERATLVGARFAQMARSFGAGQIVAVATSAAREARNRRKLIDRLREAGDFDVRIISGREEARLIYLGVASDTRLEGENALFMDIGGGSTELIVGDQARHRYLDSLRLGAIRLTNLFFPDGCSEPVSRKRYTKIQRHVRTSAVRAVQSLSRHSFDQVIGSSGTIMTLGQVAAHCTLGRPLERSDRFAHDEIKQVIADLAAMPLKRRVQVEGMSARRGDIIIAGAAILDTLLDELGSPDLMVSDRTLRDGLLIDHMLRDAAGPGGADGSHRMDSVLRLGRQCRFDETHARHVADITHQLFDSAAGLGLHEMGAWERELLEFAALLHDVGAFLSYSDHRHHSYYFIRNAELLGFDDTEIEIIAVTALFHKKTYPRKTDPQYAALDKANQKIARDLCVLLRIAESLDRSHRGVVEGVGLVADGAKGALTLELTSSGDCHLELWAVAVHMKAFARSFGPSLQVRIGPQGDCAEDEDVLTKSEVT